MRGFWVALAGALISVACGAARAPVVTTFAALPDRVNQGDSVRVIDVDGAAWRGRVVAMTPDRLVLAAGPRSGRTVTLMPDRVRQVGVIGDSVANGALVGLGAGAALGFAGRLTVWSETGTAYWGHALLLGSAGAGLGALADALIRREVVVFRAPIASVNPYFNSASQGLTLVIRW